MVGRDKKKKRSRCLEHRLSCNKVIFHQNERNPISELKIYILLIPLHGRDYLLSQTCDEE